MAKTETAWPNLLLGPTYLRQQRGTKPHYLVVTVDIVVEAPGQLQAGRLIDDDEEETRS
jgi:hypothetical protein